MKYIIYNDRTVSEHITFDVLFKIFIFNKYRKSIYYNDSFY